MRKMETVRTVRATPARVWDLVGDVTGWGRLLPTIEEVTRLDGDGPVGTGARFRVRQPGLPTAVYEITCWAPGAGFTWESSSPGVRTTATHELAPEPEGTRLTLGIEWTGPLAGAVGVLLGGKARRMVAQEADTFARLAAAGDGAAGAEER